MVTNNCGYENVLFEEIAGISLGEK